MSHEELSELQDWKRKYQVAAELWDSMELHENDQVTEAIIIGKVADFENGGTAITTGATEGLDWITQLGMYEAARMQMNGMSDPGD